ncbi:MAG: hypothetical protein ACR2K4_01420 [Candidatus Limnocylindria bacterium]
MVAAVAPIEPEHVGLADEQELAAFGDAVARAAKLATEGHLTAAVHLVEAVEVV